MLKKNLFLTFLTITFGSYLFAQNPLVKQWDYRFGGTYDEALTCFQQTIDKGFILGGFSYSDSSGDKTESIMGILDYWIIKTDSIGNKEWDATFGGNVRDYLTCLQQTNDGGYIIGGFSRSGISGNKTTPNWGIYDYWIIKIDSLGNKQWEKDIGGTSYEFLASVEQTNDGGYILGGYSNSGFGGDKTYASWGNYDYWIVKTDSLGVKEWDKGLGGSDWDYFYSLQQTEDGGFILGGYSISGISGDKTENTVGGYDYWIIKIDSLGIKQWDKDFGGTSDDYLLSLHQTTDKGYILGGYSNSSIGGDKTQDTVGGYDYWIIKIDSTGVKQWDRVFGGSGNENIFGIISQTIDGGYLVTGNSNSNISGDKTENNLGTIQSWIIKTDSLGIKQWDKTIFTLGSDIRGFGIQTTDGCYAIANSTSSQIGGYKTQPTWDSITFTADYWIIKFCDNSTTEINEIQNHTLQFEVYPNPAKTVLNLSLNNSTNIFIINLLGEIVLQKKMAPNLKEKVELDISFLTSGIYFIRVGNEVRKFVKN